MAAPLKGKPAGKDASEDGGASGLMTAAELRLLLHVAKQNPVNCAVAMSRDKVGLIVLHKKTRPRKLVAELKAQAKAKGVALDATSLRFGHVAVDGASDSGKGTFTVNKPAPATMERALLAQVRPAGLQRCEIVVDAKLEDETEEEAGAATPDTQAATVPPEGDAPPQGRPAAPPAGQAAPESTPSPPAPQTQAPSADAAAADWRPKARAALTVLARQVASLTDKDAPHRMELSGLADRANDAIKAGDQAGATAGLQALSQALGTLGAGGPPSPPMQAPTSPATAQPDADPEPPDSTAATLRAGFDRASATPRDRSGDAQVTQNVPPGTATDAGGPGTAPAPAPPSQPTQAPQPPQPPADDTSWVGADGWDYRPVPPGTPPVVMDVPRALGEFDDAHGRVLTRGAGAAQAVGGVVEGLGAGGLLLTPEPTMLTKVAGAAMGANAVDNLQAGLRTAWTGQPHQTLAAQAAGAGAQALGASPERAAQVANVADAMQGVMGGGAMTIAGIARDGAGAAARGAGALERTAPPALTGEVLPPNQPLALGGTQVRQAPVQPAWPQTVTVGPGRVDMTRPSVQPRKPPQLAPPPEPPPPPPPPTAEQQVRTLPGHGHRRHGTQTTLAEQEQRLRTGRAPDGKRSPTGQATRFDSHDAELDAVTKATTEMAARERAGLLPRDVIVAHPQGSRLRPTLPSVRLVVTGRPGGYGSGLRAGGSRSSVTLTPTGQLPSARVTFERDPLRGWIPVTQFPTGEPPTPLTPPPP